VNRIALRGTQSALKVNWCELAVTRQANGKLLYENAFITRHELNQQSVVLVTAAGQCRWKTENENHNVLKTKGNLDTPQFLSQINSLDRTKADTFRAWSKLPSQLVRVKLTVLGVEQ
jgi:hypothetical protein